MSGSSVTSGIADSSVLARLVDNASAVKAKLDKLTTQSASGLISDSYAGLGTGARVSLSLRPVLTQNQTQQTNIDVANGRLSVSQAALTQLSSIAGDFYAQLATLNGVNTSEIDSTASKARESLKQVASLLNTQDGDVYVFAGQDSANAPVPNGEAILTSGFYTQINAAVAGLATSTASAVESSALATAKSNAAATSPFSTSLSQAGSAIARIQVETGIGQVTSVGLIASANTYATSADPSSTGSAVRDLLLGLATLGSLSSGQTTASGFSSLVSNLHSVLGSAVSGLAVEAGGLGDVQKTLTSQQSALSDTAAVLTKQVSDAEDVDAAKTISQLSLVQTQLQASYQLIAGQKSLSLVAYL